jgi:Chaperone for flagella basal body P-ring formation
MANDPVSDSVGKSKVGGDGRYRAAVGLLAAWLGGIATVNAADGYNCSFGYRRQSVISDFALGQDWTVYASCAHPEGPRVAVMVSRPVAAAARAAAVAVGQNVLPTVRVGSSVRLWLSSPVARIELSAVALESGSAGATIRLRATPGGKVLRGTVWAAGSVELNTGGEGFGRAGK